jgi:hypothetical protein
MRKSMLAVASHASARPSQRAQAGRGEEAEEEDRRFGLAAGRSDGPSDSLMGLQQWSRRLYEATLTGPHRP